MNVLVNLCSCLVSEGINTLLLNNGYQGVTVAQNQSLPDGFLPHVILVDINTINRDLFSSFPGAKVLLMDTGVEKEKIVTALLSFPTHGVLSVNTEVHLFKKALDVVNEGQIWVDNNMLKAFLQQGPSLHTPPKADGVTGREKEIIDHVCRGCTNKEIAASLSLSEHTVKAHLNRIFKKFNTSSRSKLITLLLQEKREVAQ
jgi:LuxR family transcriptional regulator, positive regulator of biofilm formation